MDNLSVRYGNVRDAGWRNEHFGWSKPTYRMFIVLDRNGIAGKRLVTEKQNKTYFLFTREATNKAKMTVGMT